MNLKSVLNDAIFYWETRRILYNVVLIVLVAACWGKSILSEGPGQWLGAAIVLLFFATIANIFYCVAYPIDLAMQISPYQSVWKRVRWALFVAGLGLASALALWVMLGTGMA